MLNYIIVNENEKESVVCMHGFGSTPENMGAACQSFGKNRYILPRGPYDYMDGYGWYNVVKSDSQHREETIKKMVGFVKEMKKKYSFDKCFLLGFSQGAELAFKIALQNPELFKGAVGIVGWLATDVCISEKSKKLPVLAINGSRDFVLPLNWCKGKCIENTFKQKGVSCDLQIFDMGHEVSRECASYIKEWLAKHA